MRFDIPMLLEEFKRGRVPNPCVLCNKEIKFKFLFKKANYLKADFVATGHYARIKKKEREKYYLMRAKDKEKDQSYFLWMLSQKELSKILFPLGDFYKTEVKKIAKNFDFSASDIKESMELCFIRNRVEEFLKKYLGEKEGDILDTKGKIIGRHKGVWFYTIGQRKRISLAGGGPYYVIEKRARKNQIIVSRKKKDLEKKNLVCGKVNWILKPKFFPIKVKAKIRYKQKLSAAIINKKKKKGEFEVIFKTYQRAITPGQSIVFYGGKEEVLGGAIILR